MIFPIRGSNLPYLQRYLTVREIFKGIRSICGVPYLSRARRSHSLKVGGMVNQEIKKVFQVGTSKEG